MALRIRIHLALYLLICLLYSKTLDYILKNYIIRSKRCQEIKQLKQAKKQLEKELLRKDRALAEAAALLVLQKKLHALWGDEAK